MMGQRKGLPVAPTGRIKRRADVVLWGSLVVYAFVFAGQFFLSPKITAYVWYEGLYWLMQSVLIGSVADWFAVTALFRKPLGFPYHTALLPRQRERLIAKLADLAEHTLLSYEKGVELIQRLPWLTWLESYGQSENGRRTIRLVLQYLLQSLRDYRSKEEWLRLGDAFLKKQLRSQPLWQELHRSLGGLGSETDKEKLFLAGLTGVERFLYEPAFKRMVVELLEAELDKKRSSLGKALLIFVSEIFNVVNTGDMAEAVIAELNRWLQALKRPDSEERRDWCRQWQITLQSLENSRELQVEVETMVSQWLEEQPLQAVLERYVWEPLEGWLTPQVMGGVSRGAIYLEEQLQMIWQAQASQIKVREHWEGLLRDVLRLLWRELQPFTGRIVRQVLAGLSAEEFVVFIEEKIEDDLSWIRLNGAVIGGGIGVLLWLIMTFVYPLVV